VPCFEGLFPAPHDKTIQELLYVMCYWHALAKLHLHTESTLQIMGGVTVFLGQCLHYFANDPCNDPCMQTLKADWE
ncbi:hypothetical protein CONPUDRAFT_51317, partial [Coniophora puteana RWD-64-598 SS2]